MTIDNLVAVGEFLFVIKDEAQTEKYGLDIPEPKLKAPNVGLILSVGELVQDKNIVKGKKAVFNKQVGGEIELFGVTITVLNGNSQVNGVI